MAMDVLNTHCSLFSISIGGFIAESTPLIMNLCGGMEAKIFCERGVLCHPQDSQLLRPQTSPTRGWPCLSIQPRFHSPAAICIMYSMAPCATQTWRIPRRTDSIGAMPHVGHHVVDELALYYMNRGYVIC